MRVNSIELAYRYGITVYDAAYIALEILQKATLSTSDKEVVAKIPSPNVKHISEVF